MGLMRSAMKAGIASKLINEARKPQNQAKAKDLLAKFTNKGGQGTNARDTTSRRRAS